MSGTPPPSGWRFLVDENLPRSLAPELAALGYIAEHVYDLGMGGAKDPAVYAYAQTQHAAIITGDKDFSDIRAYPPPHAGLLVVEVPDTMPPDRRKRIILRQLATLSGHTESGWVVGVSRGLQPASRPVRRQFTAASAHRDGVSIPGGYACHHRGWPYTCSAVVKQGRI